MKKFLTKENLLRAGVAAGILGGGYAVFRHEQSQNQALWDALERDQRQDFVIDQVDANSRLRDFDLLTIDRYNSNRLNKLEGKPETPERQEERQPNREQPRIIIKYD